MTRSLERFSLDRGDVVLSGLKGGDAGELVILLHGLAGSAAEMAPLAEGLANSGHRVIALDQRGHGHSTRRPKDLSREAFVADVVRILDGEQAWIVGQSMGAHTAMLVAAEGVAKGLVMIEGDLGGGDPDYPKGLGEWFAKWPVPFKDEAAALEYLGDTSLGRAWTADLERTPDGLRPRFDADVMEAIMRPVAKEPRHDAWAKVTVPCLQILAENGDQKELGVETVVVKDAGHDVHLDQPQETLRLIKAFIGG